MSACLCWPADLLDLLTSWAKSNARATPGLIMIHNLTDVIGFGRYYSNLVTSVV